MDWVVRFAERLFEGIGSLIGEGVSRAGEKLADKAIPATRPLDAAGTSRMMHGELEELSRLSARLRIHTGDAQQRCHALSRQAVDALALQVPGLNESPLAE